MPGVCPGHVSFRAQGRATNLRTCLLWRARPENDQNKRHERTKVALSEVSHNSMKAILSTVIHVNGEHTALNVRPESLPRPLSAYFAQQSRTGKSDIMFMKEHRSRQRSMGLIVGTDGQLSGEKCRALFVRN